MGKVEKWKMKRTGYVYNNVGKILSGITAIVLTIIKQYNKNIYETGKRGNAQPAPAATATPTGPPIYYVSLSDEKKTKTIGDYQIDVDYISKGAKTVPTAPPRPTKKPKKSENEFAGELPWQKGIG